MKRMIPFLLALILLLAVGRSSAKSEGKQPFENASAQTEPVDAPPEFDLGVTITLENLTPTGATVIFTQSGGEVTGELMTGREFTLEKIDGAVWLPVEPVIPTEQIVFTEEAYGIPLGGTLEMETEWEYFYGALPAGTYRLGKWVMDFRASGDYDKQLYFAEFTL